MRINLISVFWRLQLAWTGSKMAYTVKLINSKKFSMSWGNGKVKGQNPIHHTILNHRIDLTKVADKVSNVLHGKPDLIRLFNACLPLHNWILVDGDSSTATHVTSSAALENYHPNNQPSIEVNQDITPRVPAELTKLLNLDSLVELTAKMGRLDWLRFSKEELEALIKPVAICSERVMTAWVTLIVLGMDSDPRMPLFFSTSDFDEFSQHILSDGEDPITQLHASTWFHQNPKANKSVYMSPQPLPRTPETSIYFESPLPFPLPHCTMGSTTSESGSPCTWACTRFTISNRTVQIHASKSVCQIFNNDLPAVVQSLNQRLPHVLKFWGQGDRIVAAEDVMLIEINSAHTDVAFSMGWLLDSSEWKLSNNLTRNVPTKDLMQYIYDIFSTLCKERAERRWI